MKPTGFLQVDVDGLWAVRSCYDRAENDSFASDPCWQEGVPVLRDAFAAAGTPAAFFIVGRDLELHSKRAIARELLSRDFELGNHTYRHRLGLTLRPIGFITREFVHTDKALRAIGADPCGFRAPGYDIDSRVLRVVRRFGYRYDASMLPSYGAPLFRLASAWMARKRQPGKRQFGRFSYGRAPREPYFPLRHKIRKPGGRENGLLEIPVGTTPLGLPLTAASLFGKSRAQLRTLFERIAERRSGVLLLLHAIDGTDCSRPIVFDTRKSGLGGFDLPLERKRVYLRRIVEEFGRAFDVVPARDYAAKMLR